MKQFKRLMSMCLLLAMFLGLFAGVPFVSTSAAGANSEPATDIDGNPIVNLMADLNPNFDQVPVIPGWTTMDGISQSNDHLVDDGGAWSLEMADTSSTEALWSMSDKNAIEAGKDYTISAQIYGGLGQMTVYFYDSLGTELTELTFTLATVEASDSLKCVCTCVHTCTHTLCCYSSSPF